MKWFANRILRYLPLRDMVLHLCNAGRAVQLTTARMQVVWNLPPQLSSHFLRPPIRALRSLKQASNQAPRAYLVAFAEE